MLLLIYLNLPSLNAFMTHLTQIILHLQLYLFCHLHSLFYISFRFTDLLKEITRATNEYSKGNLSYHVKPMLNDEIGRLGMSLDYMASQLNESDKFQQKFLSNISHDFRSPLTSIKGYLKLSRMELFHLKCLINI